VPPTGKGQYKDGKGGVEYESGGVSTMVRRKESLHSRVRRAMRDGRVINKGRVPDTRLCQKDRSRLH
jgi:hypothetical protein